MKAGRCGRRWPRFLIVTLLACVAVGGTTSSGFAQEAADVRTALGLTDQAIERARANLRDREDLVATEQMAQAERLQARARRAFDAGLYADALRWTRAARQRVALVNPRRARAEGRAREEMQRTDDLIERVAPLVEEAPPPGGHRFLEESMRIQDEAREALAAGDFSRATNLSLRARRSALRALRVAEGPARGGTERVRAIVERTRALVEESEWLTGAGEKAAQSYRRARAAQNAADEELRHGRPRNAARKAEEVRRYVLEALEDADQEIARDAADDAVRRSAERLGAAKRLVPPGPRGERALVAAERHQRNAERNLERGRLPACLAEVRAVSAILDRAGL